MQGIFVEGRRLFEVYLGLAPGGVGSPRITVGDMYFITPKEATN